eukprot:8275135-Alexandrium_andersonii.AAC.1
MTLAIERDDHSPTAEKVELPRVQCDSFHRRKAPACDVRALTRPDVQAKLEANLAAIPPVEWG